MFRQPHRFDTPQHATALRNRNCRSTVLLATPIVLCFIVLALQIYNISLLAEIRHGVRAIIGAG